eukprot:11196708-Alexandrium_andersonii.AAC.1
MHFPILFGIRTPPPEHPRAVQFHTWVTCLPNWNAKVQEKIAAIREEDRGDKGVEVNGLRPAFKDLYILKEAFGEAAQELVLENKQQHKLRCYKGFQLQYLVKAIQACAARNLPTLHRLARSSEIVAELLQRHQGDWGSLFRSLQNHAVDAAQGE